MKQKTISNSFSVTPVYDGAPGTPGANSIRLDISNEMDSVFTNSAGVIEQARTVETIVHLYDGATEVNISAVTFSPSGGPASSIATFSQSASGQGKKLSWAFIVGQTMADAYEIAISYTYNDVPYSAVFSVTASKGSAIWQLRPAMAAIQFSRNADNTLTPASQNVGLKLLKIDGSSTTEYSSVQTGIVVRYSTEEMPASKTAGTNWSSGDITVANSVANLYIAMFNSAGTLLDRETIPVVCDGENGSSGANAIRMDIDNEYDSIQYQGDGKTKIGGNVSTTAYLYDGATDKSADVTFSVDTANTTIDSSNYSLIGCVLTVTALHTSNQTAQDGYVTLQCTYNGVTYKAKFTVKALVNQDKFALDVNPNALFLNTDDGWDASKTIAVKVMRTPAGGGTPSAVNPSTYGLAVSASIGTLSSYNTTTNSFTLTITQAQATDNADTVIDIHKSDDASKVYDRETIPFNKAENGDNGANAIRMDIDNEYDSIQYQGDGKTKIGGNVSTTAYLYDGATDKSADVTFSVDTANTTIDSSNYSLIGRVLTVTALHTSNQTAQDGYVTLQCTYNGVTYKAKFTVKALVNQDKFALDVNPNALFLNTDDGWDASKTIAVKVMRTPAGGGTPSAVNPSTYGLAVSASIGTLSSYNTTTNSFTLTITQAQATDNADTVIDIHKSDDATKVYDRETIPFNKAENGDNGANAIRMDIDNEYDSIQYQGDGKTKIGGNVSTTAYLYDGATDKSADVTFSVDTANTTIDSSNYSLIGRILTVTALHTSNQTAQDGYVTLQCTYNGVTYKAKFTVKALVNQDKFALDVNPNALFLNTDDGWDASKTIAVKVMRTPAGGGTPSAVNPSTYGLAVSASIGTLSSYNTTTNSFTLTITQAQATDNADTVIDIHKSDDATKVYDRETIPFNKAENGDQGDTVWQAQAFKIFDVDPGSDKPTKTTEITTATTDFGNDWKKNPETPTVRDIYVDDTGLNTNIGGMTVWADMISTDPNYSVFGKGWRIAKGNKRNSSNNKYVVDRIKFTPLTDNEVFRLQIAASAEMGYDGVTVGNLNEAATISTNWGESDKSTKGATKNAIIDVTILVTDKANQECFFDIIFKKDSTTHSNDDCGYYKLTTRGGKVYSSIATIENGTVVGSWSTATQWQGNDGPEGDGIVSVVRTYAISNVNTTASDTTEPAHQGSWSESSPAVTEQYPYLWTREVVTYKFAAATTKYYCIGSRGDNGVDAQDVEWVFIRSKNATAPIIYNDSSYTDTNGKTYTSDDHLPQVSGSENIEMNNNRYQCTDDPKGVDSTWKYEWEIKRTKGTADANGRRTWNYYQGAMTLHNNYAESAFIIDLSNDNDQFGTDSDSKVQVTQVRQTIVSLYDGATKQALTALAATLIYEDGTSVPNTVATVLPNTGTGVVAVTILQNTTTALSHTAINVQITATCAKGSKQATFILRKVMGGAPGLNPIIYQLAPTNKTFSFSRNNSNGLTPASRSTTINVARTEGNSTTILTSAQTGITYQWGFDDNSTAIESNKAVGSSIEIPNKDSVNHYDAESHYQVWVELSTGDRETLPIVKDGVNGELYVIDTNVDSVTIPSNHTYVNADITGQFYKLTGSNKASHTCAFIMWKRSKTGTYTRVANSSSVNSFDLSGLQVTNDTDALVAVMQTTLTNDPTVYIAKKEIAVICDGATGATGRMFYLVGVWSPDVNYGRTDMLIPLVWRDSNTQDPATGNFGNYWYLSADSSLNNDPNTDGGDHWTKAESFGFVITQGIFAQFAKFGSAVITGDWMISGNGKIDGVDFTVDQLVTGLTVDSGSTEWNTRAYTLFDALNPRATSRSLLYGKNKNLAASGSHTLHIDNVTLSASETYSIRVYGHANYSSATPHVFVKIQRNGVGATDVLALDAKVSSHNQRAFFRVSEDGEYSVDIYETEHPSEPGTGNTYSGAKIDFIEVAKVAFAPVYAVDLLTGGSIQRDMMTSGFIRKDKTVINRLNVDYYVYGPYDKRLVFERCGSFIEIRDDVSIQFLPPVLCNQYKSLEDTFLTEEEKDYIRSIVGTKMLIYLRDDAEIMGHLDVRHGWLDGNTKSVERIIKIDGAEIDPSYSQSTVDVTGTFLYRVTHRQYDRETITSYVVVDEYTWEFRSLSPGQFVELECKTEVGPDGYEVIYWNINSRGNIA